ncbi:MAG: helix-turn-helix transcriptional regulator [Clostridia bacterium]|nr:helix-turn-helix transcriptional regulator [Clostridia bacterium]
MKFKELRTRRKISIKELSAMLGMSVRKISLWENGIEVPNKDSMERLSQVLGVSLEVIKKIFKGESL